jgi:hypothetical protein
MTPPRVTPDEWRHVQEIFLAALEKDGDTRSQYLDETCRGKAELRAEVESLLAHAGGGTQGFAAVVSEAASKLPASRDKYIDSKIGPYRFLRRLDEVEWAWSIWRNAPTNTTSKPWRSSW